MYVKFSFYRFFTSLRLIDFRLRLEFVPCHVSMIFISLLIDFFYFDSFTNLLQLHIHVCMEIKLLNISGFLIRRLLLSISGFYYLKNGAPIGSQASLLNNHVALLLYTVTRIATTANDSEPLFMLAIIMI